MKSIINLRVDVTKIDKGRFYQGKKGTYLDLTIVLNDEKDKYDNNGFVKQSTNKDEKVEMPILGNAKIVWTSRENKPVQEQTFVSTPASEGTDLPF